ncbi:efflux RND transporter periplasmic adaptor subunit [Paenibacillus chartarius]|uniref:Efflux RND transporter periplasmic adaptor subunit n=1 Tax=Paenibacillus chartarius TaxID=747481 RepID=A0ABV6DKF7_9BACL
MSTKWWTEHSYLNSKLWKPTLALGAAAALLLSSGCSLLPKEAEEEQLPTITPAKLSQKPTYDVKTQTLETKVRGSGKLMATIEEELYFTEENDGKRIKNVAVKSGDQVQAGQLIAELDVSDLESQLKQKQLQTRQDELTMIETLRKSDEVSPEHIEKAKIDFELKREELASLQSKLAKSKLTAPFAGTIVSVYVKKGDSMKAYDTIATVADLSQLTVAASISGDDLKKIAVGMETQVDINGAGAHKGKVKQLPNPKQEDSGGQNGGFPGSFPNGDQQERDSIDNYVLIELEKFPEGLNRGTPLSVSVITSRKENAVTIPLAALRSYSGRNYVQVVDAQGNKKEVDVEIGQQTATDVEIVKGLTPGQKVVGR